jgi:hypothetical protein
MCWSVFLGKRLEQSCLLSCCISWSNVFKPTKAWHDIMLLVSASWACYVTFQGCDAKLHGTHLL